MSTIPPPDDALTHAEAALRHTPIPPGPSAETVSRTLAALEAKTDSDANPFSRSKMMAISIKIAAAVLVTAAGLFYFALAPPAKATAVFAEMAQKLSKAHTLAYRSATETPDLKEPLKGRCFFKEPGLMRTEIDGGMVVIMDLSQGKQLMLDTAGKSALLLEGKANVRPDAAGGAGMIDYLRQLTEGDAKPVGDKMIGDIRARGYLVKKLGIEMTIWVDPATRLPLRMESADRIQGKEIRTAITDFQIDLPIDDALFRVEPPAGYALRKEESKIIGMDEKTFLDPERAASDILRMFAEKNDGDFPKRLDDPEEFQKIMPKEAKKTAIPDSETLRAIQAMTRFMMVSRSLKDGFGYRPEGVKLGDTDKILFWYRPDGGTRYRALYGDLHGADVTADKLPENHKP
jgi:outer membrane lipoprotein-sorting protein